MRPYPLIPPRSQVGGVYDPYYTLHGLGSAPYDLRMYHNEGVGRLGDTAADQAAFNQTAVAMQAAAESSSRENLIWFALMGAAGGTVFGFGIGWLAFRKR